MGTITKTIGSAGGRDYSTLQAWEDALPANLVTDGNSQVGECYNDSEFVAGSVRLTFGGETTDSTHTITLKCAAGQSFKDNANKLTNALRYNVSNGVGIRNSSPYGGVINCANINYIFFDGLQVAAAAAGDSLSSIRGTSATPTAQPTLTNCIVENNGGSGCIQGGQATNCLFVQHGATGNGIATIDHAQGKFANNTVVRPSDVTPAGRGFQGGTYLDTGVVVTNNAFFGFSTAIYDPSAQITGSNNCTDLSSMGAGTSNLVSKTYANQFVTTTDATRDFRLKTGADCIDAGATATTYIPGATDIVGTSRPQGSAWDIGAWELIQAAGGFAHSMGMIFG